MARQTVTPVAEASQIDESLSVLSRPQETKKKKKKTRVAAYCRVSKDIDEQVTSIETQMESFKRIIVEHPGWELAGIYADKGKTGTQIEKRVQFQKMIADAKAGKIDMILAKSTSRFARNTVDLLTVTRDLKEVGVGVYFEKEKVNTMGLQSEMLLTVYAAFAQEESFSISENMKRGIRQRFQIGVPKWALIYGLERVGKDEWQPKEGEAEIVKEIFERYLEGESLGEIANALNERGVPGPCHDAKVTKWYNTSLGDLLRNEKYAGDCLMQKYYTPDFLSHESVLNSEMEVKQYYKKDHHPAVVPRDVYEDANRIIAMRDTHRGSSMYPYYGRLLCPHCGKPMVKVPLPCGKNPSAWICGGDGEAGYYTDRTSCPVYWIKEPSLNAAVILAMQELSTEGRTKEEADKIWIVQEKLKTKESVELSYLRELVKSITFSDWDAVEITWIWGEKTTVPYKVERPTDYPDPTIRIENGVKKVGPFALGSRTIHAVIDSNEKTVQGIKKIHITPDEGGRISGFPPYVKRGE